jgi:hypothetical protein
MTNQPRNSVSKHGRTALAAILATVALAGCGSAEPEIQPASIHLSQPAAAPIVAVPIEAPKPAKRRRVGRVKQGTFKTPVAVSIPPARQLAPPITPAPRAKRVSKRASYASFRTSQLRVLRAQCATRPKGDPRCNGTRVNERVAFAAFEEPKR